MLISIITINYNNKEGLEKTIKSVRDQSFGDIEYIIIDGNSDDGSKGLINKNKSDFDYYVSEPDNGIYNAMNKGINVAKGDYLLFLNSGDYFTSELALSDFINHIDFEGDIIYGDYKFNNGGKIYPDKLTPMYFIKSSLPHQSTLIRKNVFDLFGNFDESFEICADRAFFIKCFLSNSLKFSHINYPLTVFDLSGISNDIKYKTLKQKEDERLFKEYFNIFYDDYINHLWFEKQYYRLKQNTFRGLLRRIKKRLLK